MNSESVIRTLIFLSWMLPIYYVWGNWFLKKYATTKTEDVQRISMQSLRKLARANPICIISKRINFFGNVYYLPSKGTLTIVEQRRRSGKVTFYHPAFPKGGLKYYGEDAYLEALGYQLKKGTYPED